MADQTKRIIFQNNGGGVAVIIPPRDEDCDMTLEQIAVKDVPTGRPFKIIDVADIPSDRSDRMAWTVGKADLTDGVGA